MNKNTKAYIAIAAAFVFLVVGAYIVKSGRPIEKSPNSYIPTATGTTPIGTKPATTPVKTPPTTTTTTPTTPTTAPAANMFSMADIAKHATQGDCWAAVGSGVYDLTTWVDRHPGGPNAIVGLCGTDATAAFTRQHGNSRSAQRVLVLLQIGNLK